MRKLKRRNQRLNEYKVAVYEMHKLLDEITSSFKDETDNLRTKLMHAQLEDRYGRRTTN